MTLDGDAGTDDRAPSTYERSPSTSTGATPRFTDWLRTQLDSIGPNLAPGRRQRVEQLFRRTVDLEVAFFDATTGSDAAV